MKLGISGLMFYYIGSNVEKCRCEGEGERRRGGEKAFTSLFLYVSTPLPGIPS